MIEALRQGTAEVVRTMEQGRSQSQSSVGEGDGATTVLVGILDSISQLSTQIASASDQQRLTAGEINHKLHSIHELTLKSADQLSDTLHVATQVTAQAQRQKSLVGHLLMT